MNKETNSSENKPFIPAKENKIHITFFDYFTRFLMWRTFDSCYIDIKYHPKPTRSTLYIGNHNSWWDALTPLVLNQKFLKQKPRAVMEWEQVHRYDFFKRIGCFSIDRSDPRSALTSLQYGIDWLHQPNTSLYLYPQGKIENPWKQQPSFESGVGWLIPKLNENVDVVPILQHQHGMHTSKPRLFIQMGDAINRDSLGTSKKEITQNLEQIILNDLYQLIEKASPKEPDFPKTW